MLSRGTKENVDTRMTLPILSILAVYAGRESHKNSSLNDSVVDHKSAEFKGLGFHSSWEMGILGYFGVLLSPSTFVIRRMTIIYFPTELKF